MALLLAAFAAGNISRSKHMHIPYSRWGQGSSYLSFHFNQNFESGIFGRATLFLGSVQDEFRTVDVSHHMFFRISGSLE